ncbi:cytochrome c oxidase assembly factor 6 homolog [Haliotis cracherodii]|uniref:cytochrome c oxidase assembly factor 6 homolog n=1 Tax=Haliotis cracherodii TaxID=6455 RepID=UPI0039ED4ADB
MSHAPNQEARKLCWAARDEYWTCLEKSNEDVSKCQKSRKLFEEGCTRTWVKYFDRRRDYLRYKEKIEKEGFEPAKTAQPK